MNATTNENEERASDNCSQNESSGRDLAEFCTGVALTLLMPTILYCAVIGQLWPLLVMACNDALGVVMGFVMLKRMSAGGSPSCVPVTYVWRGLRGASADELKKAA